MKRQNNNVAQRCIYCGKEGARVAIEGGQVHNGCVKAEQILSALRDALKDE